MRAQSSPLLSLLLLALFLPPPAQAGFKPGRGWPEVSTPFYHAATPLQSITRQWFWRKQVGHTIGRYLDTGSMRPVLQGGTEVMALEACLPHTPLATGQMVVFDRGDLPAVLHYIAAISRDGSHLYMSGVSTRHSDGWFHRDTVAFVVREIVTTPEPLPLAIAAVAITAAPDIEVTRPLGLRP